MYQREREGGPDEDGVAGANCQANGSQEALGRRFTDGQRTPFERRGKPNKTVPKLREARLESTKPNPSRAG